MKRVILLLFLFFMLTISPICAQIQAGYVRTLGRSDKAGEPLSGVTIRVRGEHNPTLSGEDGKFNLMMADKKNGDAFILQQVQKNDYELNEQDLLGQPLAFSDKVTLTIVMVSTKQLQADKQRIVNNAYDAAKRNYDTKVKMLEKQLSDKQISIEQYRAEIQDLQDKFEKYQTLIDGLAEHYAHADYDLMDEKDREINLCIENGELERADSLIHLLFDPIDVLQRNMEALSRLNQERNRAQDILAQANADWTAVLKQQEKDAEYLYQLYTIELSRFNNEKARFYIETRAALDTTNVEWQVEAGRYILEYLADYDQAMTYFQRALRQAISQGVENNSDVAICYFNIGTVYYAHGEYDQALEYYLKALAILKSVYGEIHTDVATNYNMIGLMYYHQCKYGKALKYYRNALSIVKSFFVEDHPDVAFCYNNIGMVYDAQGKYDQALEYLQKALYIRISVYGENHPRVAVSYNNIGLVHFSQDKYGQALEYHQKALAIRKSVLGENHPDVAVSYNNIGNVYLSQGKYGAMGYHQKALAIWKSVLGENHPDVARSYYNIGLVYYSQGKYDQAMEYFQKALAIWKSVLGENHGCVADSYNIIGRVYYSQDDYARALEYFQKSYGIYKSVCGENHPFTKLLKARIRITKKLMKKKH